MSPQHRMITTIWCLITMIATMIVSHGHLVMREVMAHWPTEDTWERRLETALYTQGGMVFASSFVLGMLVLLRGFFNKANDKEIARRELAQRERHERAASQRHAEMMSSLATLRGDPESKKSFASGVKPR